MITQVQTSKWFGPVVLFFAGLTSFGIWKYQQWLNAPAPELTWGCGPAAGVIPAGVHLPAKPEFNWWLLAFEILIAILIVAVSALVATAIKYAVARIVRVRHALHLILAEHCNLVAQHFSNIRFFPVNIFGLRAPPVVVW